MKKIYQAGDEATKNAKFKSHGLIIVSISNQKSSNWKTSFVNK